MSQPERRFRIRLAGFLGKFPHEIDTMPISDFIECALYEKLEPFGDLRGDLQAGVIAATMVNLKLPRDRQAVSPEQFMPTWDWTVKPSAPSMNPEEQLAMMLSIQAAQNSKLKN